MPTITTPRELTTWLLAKNFEIQKLEDDGEESDDRTVAIYKGIVQLEIRPEEILYEVKVQAIDDPSDSIEEISYNPMETIAEFVEGSLPGSILTSSVKPSDISKILRNIAFRVASKSLSLRLTKKAVRRLAALMSSLVSKDKIAILAKGQTEFEKTTIGNLKKKMKEKGWNVMEPEEGKLLVNIGDQFEGEIEIDTMLWEYEIGVIGDDEIFDSGSTDDPIININNFMKTPEVNEVISDAKLQQEEAIKKKREDETVRPVRPES